VELCHRQGEIKKRAGKDKRQSRATPKRARTSAWSFGNALKNKRVYKAFNPVNPYIISC
jgi:hypothetical protein